jgi:hypothetical protein
MYANRYGRLYIYGLGASRNQVNQEVIVRTIQLTTTDTIWKGRTMCVYSMQQRREKEKDSRYIQKASAHAAVTVYQTCNMSRAHVHL